MPWAAGTFSRANGPTGWQDDQAANIGIEAGRHDTQDNDFRDGINDTINKAGQNTPTANLPMGGFKHTGVANAAASAEYAAYGQVQAGVNVQSTALDWTATQYSNDTTAAKFVLQKSRGATTGSNVIVNSGDAIGTLEFRGNNGTTFTSAATITAAVDGTPGATNDMPGRLVFSTSADASGTPTERMRVDSAGRLLINTTNNLGSATGYLQVGGTGTVQAYTHTASLANLEEVGFRARELTSVTPRQATLAVYKHSTITNPAAYLGLMTEDGTNTFYWTGNDGNFRTSTAANGIGTNTGTVVGTQTSDERVKTILGPTPHGLAQVLALQPVAYTRNYVANDTQRLGFIAQQVQSIVPESVYDTKEPIPGFDAAETKLAMDYSALIPVLVKAIQELEARVAALEGV